MDEALARRARGAAIFEWQPGMVVYCGNFSDIVLDVNSADGAFEAFGNWQDKHGPCFWKDGQRVGEPMPDLDHRGTLALLEELLETPGDHVYTSPHGEGWEVCRHMTPEERQRRNQGKKLGPLDDLDDVLGEGATRAEAIVNALCR